MGDCCCDRTACSRAQAIMKKVPPCTSKSACLPSFLAAVVAGGKTFYSNKIGQQTYICNARRDCDRGHPSVCLVSVEVKAAQSENLSPGHRPQRIDLLY